MTPHLRLRRLRRFCGAHVAHRSAHIYNDPLNKVDPLGLRPDDFMFSGLPAGICVNVDPVWDWPPIEDDPGCSSLMTELSDMSLAEILGMLQQGWSWTQGLIIEAALAIDQFTVEQLGKVNAMLQRLRQGSASPKADLIGAALAVEQDATGARYFKCEESGGGLPVWCTHPSTSIPPGSVAITIGHFIFCEARKHCTDEDRHGFLAHEMVHVGQWERFGDAFFHLYPTASLRAALEARRTGEDYDCVHAYEGPAYRVGPTDFGAPGDLLKCG